MVELRPISAHEVAAEIALYGVAVEHFVKKCSCDFVSPISTVELVIR